MNIPEPTIGIKIKIVIAIAQWLYKLSMYLLKSKVRNGGSLHLGKVSCQGYMDNFYLTCPTSKPLKICDLQKYFKDYAEKSISPQYMQNHKNAKKFVINFTRISTFFVFTDGENIVLLDRANAPELQTIENNLFDCFGSVDFENSSLPTKITNQRFYNVDIEQIEYMPGFAYEDNTEKNLLGLETVIMFGFVIYISTENLQHALSSGKPIYIQNINQLTAMNNLTSKAKLAVEYLNLKRDCK